MYSCIQKYNHIGHFLFANIQANMIVFTGIKKICEYWKTHSLT
jgi:hypothetical protein